MLRFLLRIFDTPHRTLEFGVLGHALRYASYFFINFKGSTRAMYTRSSLFFRRL